MFFPSRIHIRQRDITDCGAACLCSVAAYYRLRVPVSRMRQYAGTTQEGTSVAGLLRAAEQVGLQARAAKGPVSSLTKIPLPAILHLTLENRLQHFVVLYKINRHRVHVMDPATGSVKSMSIAALTSCWTGVLVLCIPGAQFREGNQRTSAAIRFWRLLQPHRHLALQALIGAVAYTALGLCTTLYVQKIFDFVLPDANTGLLNLLSIIMLVLLAFQLFIGAYRARISLYTGQQMDAALILGYYRHLLQLPQRFFDTMRVGEIISRVNDAVKIREFINETASNLVVSLLTIVLSISLMFVFNWQLSLIVLLVLPFYAVLYYFSDRINRKWQRRVMEDSAALETKLVESLDTIHTIKRLGLEEYAGTHTEEKFIALLSSVRQSQLYGIGMSTSLEAITRLLIIAVLWTGSLFVLQLKISPGELLSFYTLSGYLTGPMTSLLGANRHLQDALIAADRLFEIIDLATESDNSDVVHSLPMPPGDVFIDNIQFSYQDHEPVFDGFTARIPAGKTTAVVGESGTGKSTLLHLLQHLYPVQGGAIRIGDTDIRYIAKSYLRSIVSVVPQQVDLFAGTVIENIAVGDPSPDLLRAFDLCKRLDIDSFIQRLPAGYHTMLTAQATILSGGQRQRLAIARALYRNPEILVLDEATAALDPVSEGRVQETLQWFKEQKKTIIIIAHRLQTIKDSDHILVLKQGKLAEEGTHTELMARNGEYRRLWMGGLH